MVDDDQPDGKKDNGRLPAFPNPNAKFSKESVGPDFSFASVHETVLSFRSTFKKNVKGCAAL